MNSRACSTVDPDGDSVAAQLHAILTAIVPCRCQPSHFALVGVVAEDDHGHRTQWRRLAT